MKKLIVNTAIIIVSFLLIYGAGMISQSYPKVEEKRVERQDLQELINKTNKEQQEKIKKTKLTIWSCYGKWEDAVHQFQSKYPNIEVNVIMMPYDKCYERYMEVLNTGEGPDIFVMDTSIFSNFNSLSLFKNLYEEPYSAQKYKEHIPDFLWNLSTSFDKKKLLGIPCETSSLVTYYRADIMKEYGFPSEPEELATYMEKPDNWIDIALKLKKDNKWIVSYPSDVIKLFDSTTSIFNKDMDFNRQSKTFYDGIDIVRKMYKNSLSSYINIWSAVGQQAIRDDKVAMLYLGSWGSEELEKWAPDQAGKWRVTRLPFNLYGSNNSVIMSINGKSLNDKEAWSFIEYYVFEYKVNTVNGAIPSDLSFMTKADLKNYKNEFLGGQKEQLFYEELMTKMNEYTITPLDEGANKIWHDNIINGISRGLQPNVIIDNAREDIEIRYKKDKQILLKSLKDRDEE